MRIPYPPNYKYSKKEIKYLNIEVIAWISLGIVSVIVFTLLPFILY